MLFLGMICVTPTTTAAAQQRDPGDDQANRASSPSASASRGDIAQKSTREHHFTPVTPSVPVVCGPGSANYQQSLDIHNLCPDNLPTIYLPEHSLKQVYTYLVYLSKVLVAGCSRCRARMLMTRGSGMFAALHSEYRARHVVCSENDDVTDIAPVRVSPSISRPSWLQHQWHLAPSLRALLWCRATTSR